MSQRSSGLRLLTKSKAVYQREPSRQDVAVSRLEGSGPTVMLITTSRPAHNYDPSQASALRRMEDVMTKQFVTVSPYPVYSLYADQVVYGTGGDDSLYGAYGNDRLYGFDG